jgi:DNA replication protein DnaC
MDEDKLQAYQLALSGHNLLILGQAGTGKTFLTTKIVKSLRHRGEFYCLFENYAHNIIFFINNFKANLPIHLQNELMHLTFQHPFFSFFLLIGMI